MCCGTSLAHSGDWCLWGLWYCSCVYLCSGSFLIFQSAVYRFLSNCGYLLWFESPAPSPVIMSWWCHFFSLLLPLLSFCFVPLMKASVLQHVAASSCLCTNDLQEHFEGNSFTCGTNIQFNTRMNWWDFGRPRSRSLWLYKARVLPCEHDISVTPPGNLCRVGTNVLLDTKINWFDSWGQRSSSLWPHKTLFPSWTCYRENPFKFCTNVPINSRFNWLDLVVKGQGFRFLASRSSQVWISSNSDQLSPGMKT